MKGRDYRPPFFAEWKAGHQDTTLAALDRAVAHVPDKTFLALDDSRLSFGEFDKLVNRFARALAALGLGEGQTLGTLLETSVDPLAAWFAANRLGAIWVPINTHFRGQFLAHQLRDSGAHMVVCESHLLDHLLQVAEELPELRTVLVRGECIEPNCGPVRILPLDAYRGDDEAALVRITNPSDLTCLIYTSGTTGPSKGCMIPHGQMMQFGWQHWEAVPQDPHDVSWSPLPIFHVGALVAVVVSSLISHGSGALSASFSVSGFWSEIERTGATIAFILGTPLVLIAEAAETPAERRCFGQLGMITGVPISLPVRRVWQERFGVGYINSCNYAQSETSKLGHVAYGVALPPLNSAGYVNASDFELMIVGDDDEVLPTGTPGELLCRPKRPNIMFSGYWRRPEATVEVWRNLWMHTGDIAKIDADNVLYFVDRKKDYLRRGGENISSWEMEATFKQHPAIAEVAVHAIKSEVAEDEVKATIVLKDGERILEEELFAWCVPRVPRFAIPRYIEFRSALPTTPTGKVRKYQLREEGCTLSTWQPSAAQLRDARQKR